MKGAISAATLLIVGFQSFLSGPSLGKTGPNQENLDIPSAVVACTYVAPFLPDLSILSKSRCPDITKSISGAGADGLGFTHVSYLVQTQMVGNVYGYLRQPGKTLEQSGIPSIGLLFVTEPIRELDDRIVVIFSGVGPERTIIFTLDGSLHAEVVYDSFSASPKPPPTPMGSIYQVKVLAHRHLLLEERRIPGGETTALSNRSFILNISRGGVRVAAHGNRE